MSVTRSYEVDRNSETWLAIEKHVNERLEMRRAYLERSGLPLDDTENARGAIDELKSVLSLAKSKPEPISAKVLDIY